MTRSPRRWQTRSTVAILVLSTLVTLVGLFRPGHYRDAAYFLPQIYGQDIVTLGFGVPLLAIGLRYAARGSLRGYVVWLGALGYMLYTWASYALMLAFNEFFLAYVALFGLSLFTLVGGVVQFDPEPVRERLDGTLPVRLTSGYFVAMGVFVALGWLSEIVPATLSGGVPEPIRLAEVPTSVIYVIDLGVLLPAVVVTAAWLWQRRAWGYVFAGVLLVKLTTIGLAVLAMVLRERAADQGGGLGEVALFGVITAASAALGAKYLRSFGEPASDAEREDAVSTN